MRLGGLDHDIIVDESPAAGRASSALLDRKHPAYKPLSTGIDQNSGGATEGHDQRHTFMVYIRRAVDYVSDRYNHQNISHGASFEHFSLARFGLLQGKAAVAAVVTAAAAPCGRC